MKVPYSKQKNEKACGAAAIQMVAEYHGIKTSQQDLIDKLGINDLGYTSKKAIRDVLDELGLDYHEYVQETNHPSAERLIKTGKIKKIQNNLEQLLNDLDSGNPAIISCYGSGEGHYVIAHSYDQDHIVVHDPRLGPNIKITKKEFEANWISGNGKWKKWHMTVSKKAERH